MLQQQPPVEDESWKRDLACVFHKMPTNIRECIYNQMPDDVKAYLDKPQPQPYAVDDDEYIAKCAWREVLEYKGLPLDTPYRYKTYSDCINVGSGFSYLESYCDSLYEDLRAKRGNMEASSSSAAQIVYRRPSKPKPKPPFRVLVESEDEDYKDSVYEKVYGNKRRHWDAEALRKQKLRKPKRYKRYTHLVYADEDSKKKRDNLIEAQKEMEMQRFKRQQKGNGIASFFS